MKSITLLNSFLSLSAIMISSTSALPTSLTETRKHSLSPPSHRKKNTITQPTGHHIDKRPNLPNRRLAAIPANLRQRRPLLATRLHRRRNQRRPQPPVPHPKPGAGLQHPEDPHRHGRKRFKWKNRPIRRRTIYQHARIRRPEIQDRSQARRRAAIVSSKSGQMDFR